MVEGEVDQVRPVPLPLPINEWTSDSLPNDIDQLIDGICDVIISLTRAQCAQLVQPLSCYELCDECSVTCVLIGSITWF